MQWEDRVYGDVRIVDHAILSLIESPTFQRLRGVRQAGPSAIAFAFKDVSRYEHSLGVYLLLGRLAQASRNSSPDCSTIFRTRRSRTRSTLWSPPMSRTITRASNP